MKTSPIKIKEPPTISTDSMDLKPHTLNPTSTMPMTSLLGSLTITNSTTTPSSAVSLATEEEKRLAAEVALEVLAVLVASEVRCSVTTHSSKTWEWEAVWAEDLQASAAVHQEAEACLACQNLWAPPQRQCTFFSIQKRKDGRDKKDNDNSRGWIKRSFLGSYWGWQEDGEEVFDRCGWVWELCEG